MKRIFAIILILIVVLSTNVYGSTLEKVNVLVNTEVIIKHDMVDFTAFLESDEFMMNPLFPLSYNGTTYLPLRSVGEMLTKDINWNNDTKTITIGNTGVKKEMTPKYHTKFKNKTALAYLNKEIKIVFNNEVITMKDANGIVVYPVTYNNSTYVPVRAISELFDKEVSWDSKTNTIFLGENYRIPDGTEITFIEAYKNKDILLNGFSIEELGPTYPQYGDDIYFGKEVFYTDQTGRFGDIPNPGENIEYKNYFALVNDNASNSTVKITFNDNTKFNKMYFYFNTSDVTMIDKNYYIYNNDIFVKTIEGKRNINIINGVGIANNYFQLVELDITGLDTIEIVPNREFQNNSNLSSKYFMNLVSFK